MTLSSVVGLRGNPGQTNYAASKAGLIGLTKALARELGSRGVRVNCIAPGYITTELTDVLSEDLRGELLKATPLARLGDPEDIARAVRFLVSDDAAFITGAVPAGRRRDGHVAMARRVVITGLGAVNAIGGSVPEVEAGLRAGRPGGGPITLFDTRDSPVTIACEVKGFDPTAVMDKKTARRTDRFCQLAVAAAKEAVAHARLEIEPEADRIGASIATGIGGLDTLLTAHKHLFEKGIERFSPFWVPALIPNMGAAFVSMELGTRGPLTAECTACSASAMSLGDAMLYIRNGMADVMLAGGSEAAVTPMGVGGFHGMRALSMRNDDPEGASRPFDATRDGLVIGEGAGVVVLEELEHARARGATILGGAQRLRPLVRRAARHGARPHAARTRRARSPWPWPPRGASRPTSTTSTRTARRRRWATPPRRVC